MSEITFNLDRIKEILKSPIAELLRDNKAELSLAIKLFHINSRESFDAAV